VPSSETVDFVRKLTGGLTEPLNASYKGKNPELFNELKIIFLKNLK
jgi:hypothetical protein